MIPASASKANIRMSIKKYLIDILETAKGKNLFFDRGYSLPEIKDLVQWVSVNFGDMSRTGLSHILVDIICASRGDTDGDLLATDVDVVFEAMTDSSAVDGKRRIDFYDISPNPIDSTKWLNIGKLLVTDIKDGPEMEGPDKTKYQLLACQLRWVAKI